jgi:hypothetical protein
VLAKGLRAACLSWNQAQAHSAVYDAERTAAFFCHVVNQMKLMTPADVAGPRIESDVPDGTDASAETMEDGAEALSVTAE